MDEEGGLTKALAFVVGLIILIKTSLPYQLNSDYRKLIKENAIIYEDQIDMYNQNNQEYAKYINSLGLTDMEIIIKVIYDIWNNIDGYGVADDLVIGYYRLSFQEEGKGVCSSFADDFTAKMNAINPEYHARNCLAYFNDNLDSSVILQVIDIERTVLEYTIPESESARTNILKRFLDDANHMVSIIDIPGENLKLMIDPTNLLIGALEDGKISILNCPNEEQKEKIIEYSRQSDAIFSEEKYKKAYNDFYNELFYEIDLTYEDIENLYGYDAQCAALKNVLEIPGSDEELVLSRRK